MKILAEYHNPRTKRFVRLAHDPRASNGKGYTVERGEYDPTTHRERTTEHTPMRALCHAEAAAQFGQWAS